MHVLFVHPNFPGQFRHIAPALAARHGWTSSFVTANRGASLPGIQKVEYVPSFSATQHNSPLTRTFENAAGHARGVYKAMKRHPGIRPDLVVAHSGFGSSLFPPYLYDCPVVNFFGVSSRVNGLCRGCDRRAGPLWSVLACGSRPVRIHQLTHVYCDIKKPFSRAWSSAPRVT